MVKELPGCAVALQVVPDQRLIVAYQNRGVRIYDISESRLSPTFLSEVATSGAANDVALQDHYAYVADGRQGLAVVDWELPIDQNVAQLGFGESADAIGIYVRGQYAYVAAGDAGFKIVDIDNPQEPALVSSLDIPAFANSVVVQPMSITTGEEEEQRQLAFLAGGKPDQESGLWVVDVTDSGNPREMGRYTDVSEAVLDVLVDGRIVYILTANHGLEILDITDPSAPQLRWKQGVEGLYSKLSISDHVVYLGRKTQGLQIITAENPESPEVLAQFGTGGIRIEDAVVFDGYLYAVDGSRGLWTIDLRDPKPLPLSTSSAPQGKRSRSRSLGTGLTSPMAARGFKSSTSKTGKKYK